MKITFLITVIQQMAHAYSKCEGELLGGNQKFHLPANITTQMMERQCELQLAVEGYNRAIYEGGSVPDTVQLPVLDATMYDFTLNTCPGSVVLYLECPQSSVTTTIHCACVNSTASTTSSTSIKDLENSQDDILAPSRHHATAYTVTAAIVICIVILGLVIYERKKTMSSITSSTDYLSDELNKYAC